MKRVLAGVFTSLAIAVAAVDAQTQNPPPTQQQQQQQQQQAQPQTQTQQDPEVTYIGCIVQGSAPTVFVLENAKKNPDDDKEKAISYVIVADPTKDLNFREHLNHQVRIVGVIAKMPTTPTTAQQQQQQQRKTEQDLQKFTVKTVTLVADRCTP